MLYNQVECEVADLSRNKGNYELR